MRMKKFLLSLATVAMAAGAYADDNLLVNGDFESWSDGKATNWESKASKSTVTQSTVAHGGKYAARVESNKSNQRIAYKALALEAGNYVFSGFLKSVDTLCTVTPGYGPIANEAVTYTPFTTVSQVSATEWLEFKDTLKLSAAADVTVYLTLKSGTGSLLFDDASLVKIGGGSSTSTSDYTQDFTQARGAWTINDVVKPDSIAETAIWTQSASYGMKATAYIGGVRYETESWLISPAIKVGEDSKLTYSQAGKYFTDMTSECTVWVSEDAKSWSQLTPDASLEGKDWNFVDTHCDLTKFAGKTVYLGFKYTSTTTGCSTWEIKNVTVSNASSDVKVELKPIANTKETAYTTAEAIAILKGENYNLKDSVYVKGTVSMVDQISSSTGAMIYWLDDNTFEVYYGLGLNSAKFESLSDVNPGDEVIVKGMITLYGSTYEITGSYMVEHKKSGTVVERKDPSNTVETAYTVAEIKAILDNGSEYDLSKSVYVKGTVSKIDSFNETYGSLTYWLDDNAFQVYSGLHYNSGKFSSADDLKVGDEVVVCGVAKIHNKEIYELDKNNYLCQINGSGLANVAADLAGKQIFNLLGQPVSDMSKRGVYVVGGKKVVVR